MKQLQLNKEIGICNGNKYYETIIIKNTICNDRFRNTHHVIFKHSVKMFFGTLSSSLKYSVNFTFRIH